MHASTCALQGASAGASTAASSSLSGGRLVPCALLSSRPRCSRVCVLTAAARTSPAAGDNTPAVVPRRLVLASPPALLLAVACAAALQPGSAAAASRRLKAPSVDQYLTLPVRVAPCLLAYVLRLRWFLTRMKTRLIFSLFLVQQDFDWRGASHPGLKYYDLVAGTGKAVTPGTVLTVRASFFCFLGAVN